MITLTTDETNALSGRVVYMARLLLLDFAGGAVALNTSNYDLSWSARTWRGAYGLGSISPVRNAAGQVQGLTFELSASSDASLTLALDGADQWQGTPVSLYTALVNAADLSVAGARLRWTGYGDTFTTRETPPGLDGQPGRRIVVATAESSQVDLLRGHPLTYSHADQQSVAPGDRFFEYVNAQSDKPVVWPAKEWFYK